MNRIITLKYIGDAVSNGSMDALEVANNIIAFKDFIDVLSNESYGEKANLQTNIEGFNKGSFDVVFSLNIGEAFSALLPFALNLNDLIAMMKRVINVFKFLGGKPPKSIKVEGTKIIIENNNGTVINVDNRTYNAVTNEKTIKSLEKFVKHPLQNSDIDVVELNPEDDEKIEISKSEAHMFVEVDTDKPLKEWEAEMGLLIVSPVFNDGNKWKFSDGSSTFYAEIKDQEFIDKVNDGRERFGKGDRIIAKVLVKQTSNLNALKQDRSIIKVIEHTESPFQRSMF